MMGRHKMLINFSFFMVARVVYMYLICVVGVYQFPSILRVILKFENLYSSDLILEVLRTIIWH